MAGTTVAATANMTTPGSSLSHRHGTITVNQAYNAVLGVHRYSKRYPATRRCGIDEQANRAFSPPRPLNPIAFVTLPPKQHRSRNPPQPKASSRSHHGGSAPQHHITQPQRSVSTPNPRQLGGHSECLSTQSTHKSLIRSHSDQHLSSTARALPAFAKSFDGANAQDRDTGTPLGSRFTGTEVPIPEVARNMPAIVLTRHRRVRSQRKTRKIATSQRSAERKRLEDQIALIQAQTEDKGEREAQSPPPPPLPPQQEQSSVPAEPTLILASVIPPTAVEDLFPHQRHIHGRFASRPTPFDERHDPAHLRPRKQPERFPGDLYTPAIVRAGKSCGQDGAAGAMGSKEAWCGLCLPHQASGYGRGNSLVGGWLNLRNSSYRYHMIRAHGISPKTCLQYQEPLETRRRQQGVDGKVGEGSELKGLCHQCDKWITFGAIEPTNWWVHASKCHKEQLPESGDTSVTSSPCGQSSSSSPLKVLATTNKHNVSSASGSPLKKVKFDTISSQEHAKKHQKHSLLPRKRTASESTQPTHYAGQEGICSSSRVILATPRGKRPASNKTAEGDEDAMESKPFFSVAEPGWTISSSGRIVKLRDAKSTNAI